MKPCPLSSIRDANNNYVRKVKVGGKCVNPTPENVRASKRKAFQLRVSEDIKRGKTKRAAKPEVD